MEEAIFANGVPRRITPEDIKRWHLASFPALMDEENSHVMEEAIEAVYAMFSASQVLFDLQPKQIWYEKTIILFRFLVCWYIADQYPTLVSGQSIMGGTPLKSKKIGGVNITFQDQDVSGQTGDYQDLLAFLKSNTWGNKAYAMIRNSGKRLKIGGSRRL